MTDHVADGRDPPDAIDIARVPMPTLLADLRAEHQALDAVLDQLRPQSADTPTPADGWAVRDQLAHLAEGDELAGLAARDPDTFQSRLVEMLSDLDATLENAAGRAAASDLDGLRRDWTAARSQLVNALAGYDVRDRISWVVGPMSAASFARARLMEIWAHGQDIVDAVGLERPDTDDRLRHVVYLGVRTRGFSYSNRGLDEPDTPVRLDLTSPSGQHWIFGPPDAADRVVGPARDFALVVTQRRHHQDTELAVVGRDASEWMSIAQVFAGPPTDGRPAGMFAH